MTRAARLAVKRLLDIIIAGATLLVAAPLLAVIALAVRVRLGSPVLFRHERPGLGGRPFTLYKFRTMTSETDAGGVMLPDDQRITRFGTFLRSSSLDELPELFNVLRGDMSLVGPRPLLMSYLPRYSARQARRQEMRPGLTGLAQVSGRNALSWPERLELDVRYIEGWSLAGDFRILLRTFGAVFGRRGIAAEGHVTMPYFTGNDDRNGSVEE